MGSNLAPGVEIIERSFSTRIEAGDQTVFATLGLFKKGPVNETTRISSPDQLRDVFGSPDDATFKYFFPISTMLDQAPVEVVRVEESTVACAGLSIATSGSDTVAIETPIKVSAYPLTYDSVFTPDDDLITQVEFTGGEQDTITFAGVGPGQYYNNIQVATINKDDYDLLRDLQLTLAEAVSPADVQAAGQTTYNLALSGSGGLTFSLAEELIDPSNSYDVDEETLDGYLFFENGPSSDDEFGIYEYEGGSIVNAYLVSTDPTKKDAFAKGMFANRVVEDNSVNIRVFVGTSKITADAVTPQTMPKTSLAGADDISGTTEAMVQDEMYIQLNENFLNKEEIRFTAFVDLDFPLPIKQRMDQICQIRKDCIALLNVDASTMINLSSGQKVKNATTAIKNWVDNDLNINSSYSGVYANYFQVYDAFNDENRWIPCTGHVANRMAFTIANFEPWFAFAGLERGVISGVLKVAFNPDDAKRKVLYPARVNCIVDFRGEGIVIWGQKTLLATPSSLDRLNVRNLFIYIEIALERFSRFTLFKQNDEFTRAEWRAAVGPFMNSVMQRRGVLDFLVVCDESNNTPEVVARNEFQAYVLIRPTPVVEFIKIVVADVGGNLTFDEVLGGVQI
jgi:hypothetical protein